MNFPEIPKSFTSSYFLHILAIFIVIVTVIQCVRMYNARIEGFSGAGDFKSSVTSVTKKEHLNTPLHNCYIMSSFNSCLEGSRTSGKVSSTALKNVIRLGTRFLDFELYSIGGNTVIAVSDKDSFSYKSTPNHLPLKKTLEFIKYHAIEDGSAMNSDDPLLLHFRIKSEQSRVYSDLDKALREVFGTRLASNAGPPKSKNITSLGQCDDLKMKAELLTYSYEACGRNIFTEPVGNLKKKVIIGLNGDPKKFHGNSLHKLVNFTSGTGTIKYMTNTKTLNEETPNTLKEHNRQRLSVVVPDYPSFHVTTDRNPSFDKCQQLGCQIVGMLYDTNDTELEKHLTFFSENRSAFVPRPKELNYIKRIITVKPMPDKLRLDRRGKKVTPQGKIVI